MIPLLTRIDQELAACSDELRRGELLAEKACYLARVGEIEGASAVVGFLRGHCRGGGGNSQLLVWVMLIEALILYFDKLSSNARDRLFRAWRLSQELRLPRLIGLTSAWLAHLEFDRSAYNEMADMIAMAVAAASSRDSDTLIRVGMVMGDANLHLGNRTESQNWYESARLHAVSSGDQAAIGALMYNRAAFGLSFIRVSDALGLPRVDKATLEFVSMELESAWSFQIGTQVRALAHLTSLCRARVEMLNGKFQQALQIFEPIIDRIDLLEARNSKAPLIADAMLCYAALGRRNEVDRLFVDLCRHRTDLIDSDDEVILLFSAAKALKLSDRHEDALALMSDLEGSKLRYASAMQELRLALVIANGITIG